MQKPKNRNGRPSSPLKAAMALWAERRIPVSHLPSEAPDSVYEPLEEAASEAEQGFASELSRDWQEFRLKNSRRPFGPTQTTTTTLRLTGSKGWRLMSGASPAP